MATRAVRIVKLVRIIRIVKLYKSASQAADLKQEIKRKKMMENRKKQEHKSEENREEMKKVERREGPEGKPTYEGSEGKPVWEETNNDFMGAKPVKKEEANEENDFLFDSDLLEEIKSKESKISKVLSDLTIQKVIIVVLLIMFLVPLFDSDNYISKAESWDFTVQTVHSMLKDSSYDLATISGLIENQISKTQGDNFIILFSTPFVELPFLQQDRFTKERIQDITSSIEGINVASIMAARPSLTLRSDLDATQDNEIYAVMDYRYNNQRDASNSALTQSSRFARPSSSV